MYPGAARVIRWHRRIFGVKPTWCCAYVSVPWTSAVRTLVDHGLRVVIDDSDNSLQSLATVSLRQQLVPVQPMERGVLEAVPELKGLMAAVKESGDADVVWVVLGGVLATYRLLMSAWKRAGRPPSGQP